MISTILGWVLVALGVASYLGALIVFIKPQFAPAERVLPSFENSDLKAIAEVLDKLAKALESFSKLSVPVQWALLGLVKIGIGSYLIATKPF